jgi:hypothetical protein
MKYLKNESCKGCLKLTVLLMSMWDGDMMHKLYVLSMLESTERLIIYATNGGPFEPAVPKHLVPSQPKVKRRV